MINTSYKAVVNNPKTDADEKNTVKLHRIAVIDSNYFRSKGLCSLLSQLAVQTEVLCRIASVSDFLAFPSSLYMHINLLIIHPGSFEPQDSSGIAFLTQILRTHPHCRVFMVVDTPCDALLAIYHALGVSTILSARATLDVLQTSLRAGLLQTEKPTAQLPKFTERELIALQNLLAGISVAKLARQLGISCKTIYAQRSNALQKLGLRRPLHIFDHNSLLLKQFIHQLQLGTNTPIGSTEITKQ